jgi:hypothetical protein
LFISLFHEIFFFKRFALKFFSKSFFQTFF